MDRTHTPSTIDALASLQTFQIALLTSSTLLNLDLSPHLFQIIYHNHNIPTTHYPSQSLDLLIINHDLHVTFLFGFRFYLLVLIVVDPLPYLSSTPEPISNMPHSPQNLQAHVVLCLPDDINFERIKPSTFAYAQVIVPSPRSLPSTRVSTGSILTLEFLLISVLSLAFSGSLHTSNTSILGWVRVSAGEELQFKWMEDTQRYMIWYAWFKMATGSIILTHGLPTPKRWIPISEIQYLSTSILFSLFGFVYLLLGTLLPSILVNETQASWLRILDTSLSSIISLLLMALPGFCTFWALSGIFQEFNRLFASYLKPSSQAYQELIDVPTQVEDLDIYDHFESLENLPPYQV